MSNTSISDWKDGLLDYNADKCPHGNFFGDLYVGRKINLSKSLDIIKCDKCYNEAFVVGDLHVKFAVDDDDCEHWIIIERE